MVRVRGPRVDDLHGRTDPGVLLGRPSGPRARDRTPCPQTRTTYPSPVVGPKGGPSVFREEETALDGEVSFSRCFLSGRHSGSVAVFSKRRPCGVAAGVPHGPPEEDTDCGGSPRATRVFEGRGGVRYPCLLGGPRGTAKTVGESPRATRVFEGRGGAWHPSLLGGPRGAAKVPGHSVDVRPSRGSDRTGAMSQDRPGGASGGGFETTSGDCRDWDWNLSPTDPFRHRSDGNPKRGRDFEDGTGTGSSSVRPPAGTPGPRRRSSG